MLEGLKGPLRLAHLWVTEVAVRRDAQFNLAIGANGRCPFRDAGYRLERIFRLTYFLRPLSNDSRSSPRDDDRIVETYLCRIGRPKRIYICLDAIERVKSSDTS